MPSFRLHSLSRLFLGVFLFLFVLHFLSTSFEPTSYTDAEPGWSERLGLDHYADWEAGVTGRLGDGLDAVRQGLGAVGGGLVWGTKGTKLGSLYELVATSNPIPRPAYFDERTSIDRLRLTSTRVLGHGPNDDTAARDSDDDDEGVAGVTQPRRHILVTGGFGSLGKHVVRDLLLGLSSGTTSKALKGTDDWTGASPIEEASAQEDLLITIVDVKDRSAELNFLLQTAPVDKGPKIKGTDPRASAFASSERSVDNFKRAGKLRIVIADVRDKDAMKKLLSFEGTVVTEAAAQQAAALLNAKLGRPKASGHLTTMVKIPPVSGIVHLAAYSPSACRSNPTDCENVETEGMDVILEQLERPGQEKHATSKQKAVIVNRPWLVVPRRSDRWNDIPDALNQNASAASLVNAEETLKTFTEHHPLHSILLRLPSANSIIGDPYASRYEPIPHLVQSALGNLPIQIYTSRDQVEPFLAADDASRSIVQSARMLELASKKKYLRAFGFVAELDVVGPEPFAKGVLPLVDLVKTTVQVTQSQSPYSEVQQHVDASAAQQIVQETTGKHVVARKKAEKVLGFTPSMSVRVTLKRYLSGLLKLHATHLSGKINVACSSPPSTPVLEEGMLALSGCNAQLLTLIEGAYWTLGCSHGIEGPHLEPLAIVPAVPFKEGVRGVEILAERGLEGKVDLQLRCPQVQEGKPTGQSEVVIWADTPDGGEFAMASKPDAHPIAEWYSVDFVHRDSRSFTLTLPPTQGVSEGEEPKRVLTMKDPSSDLKRLFFRTLADDARAVTWRVNPICCAMTDRKRDVWDFFKEDPLLASQVTFPSEDGRTTLLSSTMAVQKCRELHAEHDRLLKLQHAIAPGNDEPVCNPKRGEASAWPPKDLPTCAIDCLAPLKCLASETCKCTRDRCGDANADGPFPGVTRSDRLSYSKSVIAVPRLSLQQRVDAIPWDNVILPAARRAFATPLDDLPFAHVVDLPDSIDNHLSTAACWNIDKSPLPFLGDHILVEALRNRSVPIDEADFVMVPYYQGCYYNYLQENTFKKLADTVGYAEARVASTGQITASKIVVPFTHDFGSCTGWWPKLEDVLGRSVPSPMDQAVAWQVNGDHNTRCVKPDRDVIIPAVTKHTKALLETFKTAHEIAPVQDRKHLAFFAGGVRGFGAIVRTKLGCGRTEGQEGNGGRILYQQYAPGQRYLGTLSAAKFCLLPRGIPAWTTRTFEAIYAGCIPAFIVDRNLFPFQDILDYSLFSVSIPESEAHRVEEILAAYTERQLIEMQAHLVKVRDAFVFKEGAEWDRKGPLFYSLVSMMMRLDLGYPQVGSCGTVGKDTTQ